MRTLLSGMFFFAFLTISCKKNESEVIRYGDLKGIITSEYGVFLDNAEVKIDAFKTSSYSSSNGTYSISKLKVQEYTVSVSKLTYLTQVKKILLTENKENELNFTLAVGEPYLNISESSKQLVAASGMVTIQIKSNSGWTVSNTTSWLFCSASSGGGDGAINVNWNKNDGQSERTDTIYFNTGKITKKLVISQSAPLNLISFEGIVGNQIVGATDSVALVFNRPIKTIEIKPKQTTCISTIKYHSFNQNLGIMFSYACAKLGGEYSFTISATDTDGNIFNEDITVPFYKSKHTIQGHITEYILINDDKEVLMATYNPCKVIHYSIEQDKILQTYDLSNILSPLKMMYNPYNGKVYLAGTGTEANLIMEIHRPELYTLDIKTGQIVKELTIKPDATDHPQMPAILPIEFAFTKYGTGILILRGDGSDQLKLKIINCSQKDTTYLSPDLTGYEFFCRVYPNYDQTKLILMQGYGSCDYAVFDGKTQKISFLRPPVASRSGFIVPNRTNEKIYFNQVMEQFIMDLSGNVSKLSYMTDDVVVDADFCYRLNGKNVVYYCTTSYFNVLDYDVAVVRMYCDVIETNRLKATVDGKYVVTFNHDHYSPVSYFYVFDTKYFHR